MLKIDSLELKFVIKYRIMVTVKRNNRLKMGIEARIRHVKLLQLKKVCEFSTLRKPTIKFPHVVCAHFFFNILHTFAYISLELDDFVH